MDNIVLYCKSFSRDVQRVKLLLSSIERHNKDNLPFYISVPASDVTIFRTVLGFENYRLVTDEDITSDNLIQSWNNQQVAKMLFWKLGLSSNTLILDSDSYFIKDFYISDFIHHDDIPYTVIHEQKDLFGWTANKSNVLGFDPMKSFGECRTPIQTLFDRKGRLYDFGPVPVIWSSKVLETLEREYLMPNELTFQSLIDTIPSEFSWYGETLLTWKPIELWPIEPMFKVFHYMAQYQEYKNFGYSENDLSKNYLGIVMQSSSGLPEKY